jgi:hypothetical protein
MLVFSTSHLENLMWEDEYTIYNLLYRPEDLAIEMRFNTNAKAGSYTKYTQQSYFVWAFARTEIAPFFIFLMPESILLLLVYH